MSIKEVFQKTVFLLGAGASVGAGCKTSSQMLIDLQTQINKVSDGKKRKHFQDIYSFLIATLKFKFSLDKQDELARRVINIEDFFMILRQLVQKDSILPQTFIGAWNHKIIQWELTNPDILNEFMQFILTNLKEDWTKHNQDETKMLMSPIKDLSTNNDIDDIHIFTLNYDLVFEGYFKPSVEMETGFRSKFWRACFDNYIRPPTENTPIETIKLKYYKLHGSLDWWYDNEDEEVRLVDDVSNNPAPLLVFGTEDKVVSADPFLYLLGKFREQLSKSNLCVVIGYSFSDHHVNNLLLQQLKNDPSKKILVVDPCFADKDFSSKIVQKKKELVEYVEDVQKRKSSKDFKNIVRISEEKIDILPLTAQEFYREYFLNNAEKLTAFYEDMQKAEDVF